MEIKLNKALFDKMLVEAEQSPRKRSHFNIHQSHDEPVQRLCIALKQGTYVRPHYHPQINKWEMMLPLQGRVLLLIFDDHGKVLQRNEMQGGKDFVGVELSPNTWHTVMPLDDEAIILEIKEGPFTPTDPSQFATWAPEEDDSSTEYFLNWALQAKEGDFYSA